MRCVVIVGRSSAMDAIAAGRPAALLPCIDRPIVQHLIEFVADRGITNFDFVLEQAPEGVESFLGDGKRWGCRFTFHMVSDAKRPYGPLKVAAGLEQSEHILLIHADRWVVFPETEEFKTTRPGILYCQDRPARGLNHADWTGWALLSSEIVRSIPRDASEQEIEDLLCRNGAQRDITSVRELLDFRTLPALIQAQRSILTNSEVSKHLSAREVERGVWLARNVVLHPTARLIPPVFIGENSRIGRGAQIGPNAVVGHDSIIDTHTTIANSTVCPGSYCGQRLELDHVFVDRNRLLHGDQQTAVEISDSFILSSMKGQPGRIRARSLISSLAGTLLFILTLPAALLTVIFLFLFRAGPIVYRSKVIQTPASEDPRSWKSYELRGFRNPERQQGSGFWLWFLMDFIPALPQVAGGRLRLIGVQPRGREEIEKLSPDWRSLYLQAHAGLITEAFVLHGDSATDDEVYTSEAYYSVMSSFTHDVWLAARFMARI